MKYYTGVGSRETPPEMLLVMQQLAQRLSQDGWFLRTGNARGADAAFASGTSQCIRYSPESLKHVSSEVYETCKRDFYELHPAPQRCSDYAKQLHMRNGLEILGHDPNEPKSRFVVCWTPNAQEVGGTAQAIRLARKYNIPVFNLANPEHLDRILGYIYQHLGE